MVEPAKRELSMRQLRHLLRLHHDGVSAREIGRRLGVARSTIQDNLKRAAAAGLAWPLADDVTEEVLELRLFGRAGVAPGQRRRVEPDWAALARELKRPGVTMMILWEEYREVQPEGYGYSRFAAIVSTTPRTATLLPHSWLWSSLAINARQQPPGGRNRASWVPTQSMLA